MTHINDKTLSLSRLQ